MPPSEKQPGAFLTIGELSSELGVAQHILRYWETKFPLRPLQRAGNRRYYRPADADLARRINHLLNQQGYTVKGVQKLLASGEVLESEAPPPVQPLIAPPAPEPAIAVEQLKAIRDLLQDALDDQGAAGAKVFMS
jgi:DNA-binding transcriptional MerR regulator